jgi:hypothetical protein
MLRTGSKGDREAQLLLASTPRQERIPILRYQSRSGTIFGRQVFVRSPNIPIHGTSERGYYRLHRSRDLLSPNNPLKR